MDSPVTLRVILLILALGQPLPAAVIDLFEEGARSLSTNTPGGPVAGVDSLSSSLFARRTASLSYGGGNLSIDPEAGLMSYEARVAGGVGASNYGYFDLKYHSSGTASLSEDGATAFRLTFEGLVGSEGFNLLTLVVRSGTASSTVNFNRQLAGPSGEIVIPFSSFKGVNMAAVTSVAISGARIEEGSGLVFTSFTTVPEPSAPLLASFCAAGLLLTRRRR